jgi:hypothetical protein
MLFDRAKNGACPEPDSSLDGIIDFRELLSSKKKAVNQASRPVCRGRVLSEEGYHSLYGNLFSLLHRLIEHFTTDTNGNGQVTLNDLVASLTTRQSKERGNLHYPGQIFKQDLNLNINGLVASIEFGVFDLKAYNLDSVGSPVRLLQPVTGESSLLDNTASIGADSEPLRIEFRFLIKGKSKGIEVHNDLILGLNLKSLDVMFEFLVQIKEMNMFVNFPLRDIMNINCWLATVITPTRDKFGIPLGDPASGIRNVAFSLAEASLDIQCIECSSPLIVEMESMLGSKEAIADTTEVANVILDYISQQLGGEIIQYQIDKKLTEAALKCPHYPTYTKEFSSIRFNEMVATKDGDDVKGFLIATIFMTLTSCVIVTIIYVVARRLSKRRHESWVSSLNIAQKVELEQIQREGNDREKDFNDRMTSLVRDCQIPLFMRVFIPVMILGDVALFLCSHIFLGGRVNISGSFAGQSFHAEGYYEFSMVKSTVDIWNAGGKALAIMIAIISL